MDQQIAGLLTATISTKKRASAMVPSSKLKSKKSGSVLQHVKYTERGEMSKSIDSLKNFG